MKAAIRYLTTTVLFWAGVAAGGEANLPLFTDPLQAIDRPVPYKNSVVIVHGWKSRAISVSGRVKLWEWPYQMAQNICDSREVQGQPDWSTGILKGDIDSNQMIRVCHGLNWDVWVVDWSLLAGDCSLLNTVLNRWIPCGDTPDQAYRNAAFVGDIVAAYLEQLGYKHVHLIAHSAGSNLIETVKEKLLKKTGSTALHMTFLDPFDPGAADTDISGYGAGAQWVENYLDTNTIAREVSGLADPKNLLVSGYNFDVTQPWIVPEIGHQWPYKFYMESVTSPGYRYGFPLSLEANGSLDVLSALKPYRICEVSAGAQACVNVSTGRPVRAENKTLCHVGSSDCPWELEPNSTVDESVFGASRSDGSLMLDYAAGQSQPSAAFLGLALPEGVTHLSFDYSFQGERGCLGLVTFDGAVVRLLMGTASPRKQVVEVPPVWLENDLLSGPHTAGFIVKNLIDNACSMQISNVRFARQAWSFSPGIVRGGVGAAGAIELEWTAMRGATRYVLDIQDKAGERRVYEVLAEEAQCAGETGNCLWTLPYKPSAGMITWRVRGKNSTNEGLWSRQATIDVQSTAVKGESERRSGGGALLWLLFLPLITRRRVQIPRCIGIDVSFRFVEESDNTVTIGKNVEFLNSESPSRCSTTTTHSRTARR